MRDNRSVSWFKLVGSTEDPVPEDWLKMRPDLLTEVRFPWNKRPDDIWAPGHLILYAVGSGALIADQQVDGPPQILPRRGKPGTPTYRWPHKIAVKTEYVCCPLDAAPSLRVLAPDFADRHKARFWNGSHWRISDDEYAQLSSIIRSYGTPVA